MSGPEFELLATAGFEWDEIKSNANLIKHGISFEEATEVFTGQQLSRDQNATMRSDGSRSENLMIDCFGDFYPPQQLDTNYFGAPSETK